MLKITSPLCVYPLLLLISACGKTGIGEDDFKESLIATTCERMLSCCNSDSDSSIANACQSTFDQLLGSPPSGATLYDDKAAEQCVQAVANSSCAFDDVSLSACQKVYTGTLAPGAACSSSDECRPPTRGIAYCDSETGPNGVCVQIQYRAEGESCGAYKCDGGICNHGPCSPEFFCNPNRVCETPRAQGSACTQPLDCASGLLCKNEICAAVVEGEPCASSDDCPGLFYCKLAEGTEAGSCEPLKLPGDACGSGDVCAEGSCESGVCAQDLPYYCAEL